MKTISNKLMIIAFMLISFIANQQLKAQGNVISVTPDSTQIGNTVLLNISGHNTVFSQATTSLHCNMSNLTLFASSFNVVNDSSMTATFIIPNNAFYVGLWDVNAGNAAALVNGFEVTSPNVVVQGNIFKDTNGDCVMDPTEIGYGFYSYFYVTVQPGNLNVTVNNTGFYAVSLPLGTYAASVSLHIPPWWTTNFGTINCPTTDNISIATTVPQIITNQNFGVEFNIIKGNVYSDNNGNCILDSAEQSISGGYVTFSYGPRNTYVHADGSYSFQLPLGIYSGNLQYTCPTCSYYSWETVTCPVSGSIPISFTNNYSTTLSNNNFGLTVTDTCPRIKITISTANMRPCFYHHSEVYVQNLTPFPATNVVVVVNLDNVEIPLAASLFSGWTPTPWTAIAGHTLIYNIGNLGGFGNRNIIIWDSTQCGTPIGDTVRIDAFVSYLPSACVDSVFSYANIYHITTLSADPNNKETTSPFWEEITANDELNYTINFQNTGTDTAFNVTVIDTLPSGVLPTSLIPAGSSHPYTFTMTGNNIAKFTFHNIKLPDSTASEINSHGFVNFSIRQVPGNISGTIIRNHAAIYFDFNSPIITNNTYNIILWPTDIVEQSNDKEGISTFPNPFTNATKFIFINKNPNAKYTLFVYDIAGKKVREINNITENFYELKRENLTSQIYFYKVFNKNSQIGVGKLIIMD